MRPSIRNESNNFGNDICVCGQVNPSKSTEEEVGEGVGHQKGEGEEGVQHSTWDNFADSSVLQIAALAVHKPLAEAAVVEEPGAVVAAAQGWVASQDRRRHR